MFYYSNNSEYNNQAQYIKKYINPLWIYLNNKTYGIYDKEQIVFDDFPNANFIVQSRSDIILNRYYNFNYSNIKLVEIGVESFDDKVLKGIEKGYLEKDNILAIQELNLKNKIVVPNIMLNTPYHTLNTYKKDYQILTELIESERIHYFHINVMSNYHSKNSIDWNENNIIRTWNSVYEFDELQKWYEKFINLQKSLV